MLNIEIKKMDNGRCCCEKGLIIEDDTMSSRSEILYKLSCVVRVMIVFSEVRL